jgi:hypothetical protein
LKGKYFLLGFLFLNIIVLSTVVQVQAADTDYSLGIKKGTEITLEVTTVDEDKLERAFGDGWEEGIPEDADTVGMKSKIIAKKEIEDAEIDLGILGDYDALGFEADIWEWTEEGFEKEPDEEDFEIVWFQDPEDQNDAYDPVNGFACDIIMPFIPITVSKFLRDIEWNKEWENEGNMVLHDSKSDEDRDFLEVYIYDPDTGFLIGYKIVESDGDIMYEYKLASEIIPGYEIPLILGITGIFIVGLLYLMKKRYNFISN